MNEQDYANKHEAAFPLDLIHLIVGPAISSISFHPSTRVFYFRRFASAVSRSEPTTTRNVSLYTYTLQGPQGDAEHHGYKRAISSFFVRWLSL